MSSLVLELQREAMNTNSSVSDLLRKALVVASKLQIEDIKNWIDEELAGYKGEGETIPQYRHLRGELKATHPHYNEIPFMVQDPKLAEKLSARPNGQPIRELEHLAEDTDHHSQLTMPFPQEVLNQLDSGNLELGIVPHLLIDKSRIKGIIDAVRNIILKWSLSLEQDGIMGEGLTFSTEEKQKAGSTTYNIQNFTGVAGNVQSENLQIGDYNQIHSVLKQLGVSQEERNELENILDKIRISESTEEKKNLIRRGGDWLRRNAPAIGSYSQTIQGWFDYFTSS